MTENTNVEVGNVEGQTPEQAQAFFRASQAGALRRLAGLRGGTGDLRTPLTAKQQAKRIAKRKVVKQARRVQRGLI